MKNFLDFIHNTKTQAYLVFLLVIGGGLMLCFGHLSASAEGRILDLMYLGPSFYFIASKSSAAKDEAIATLASNQQSNVQNADNVTINTDKK